MELKQIHFPRMKPPQRSLMVKILEQSLVNMLSIGVGTVLVCRSQFINLNH